MLWLETPAQNPGRGPARNPKTGQCPEHLARNSSVEQNALTVAGSLPKTPASWRVVNLDRSRRRYRHKSADGKARAHSDACGRLAEMWIKTRHAKGIDAADAEMRQYIADHPDDPAAQAIKVGVAAGKA